LFYWSEKWGALYNYGYWAIEAKKKGEVGAQIDIVVDYGNNLFDIVECKYYKEEFEISTKYKDNLLNKRKMFREYGLDSKKNAEIRLVFITVEGVKKNANFNDLNIDEMLLEELLL